MLGTVQNSVESQNQTNNLKMDNGSNLNRISLNQVSFQNEQSSQTTIILVEEEANKGNRKHLKNNSQLKIGLEVPCNRCTRVRKLEIVPVDIKSTVEGPKQKKITVEQSQSKPPEVPALNTDRMIVQSHDVQEKRSRSRGKPQSKKYFHHKRSTAHALPNQTNLITATGCPI